MGCPGSDKVIREYIFFIKKRYVKQDLKKKSKNHTIHLLSHTYLHAEGNHGDQHLEEEGQCQLP